MNGILLVNKPKGWTSFDAVAKVRGVLRHSLATSDSSLATKKVKVGHTGTLDPLATGLLVLLIGNATKKATELSKLDKTYEAIIKLGETSSTGDEEGEKKAVSNQRPADSEIQKVLNSFVGEIEQVPPAYSAIKVDGQRAYKLARAGKEVKIEPRRIRITDLRLKKYNYPLLEITAHVSSGTYIRTLAEDIGQALGTGAYLADLKRTRVGQFDLKDAISVEKINAEEIYSRLM